VSQKIPPPDGFLKFFPNGWQFDSNCTCAVKNISILMIEVIINYVRPITSIYQATSSFDLNSIDDCSCTIAAICIDAKNVFYVFIPATFLRF